MAGRGFDDLDRPEDRHNPALHSHFTSPCECMRLDRAASRALARAAALPDALFNREAAARLSHLLDYESRGEGPPQSRASHLFSGNQRMRVGGAHCRLIHEAQERDDEVSFVTLCPRDGDVLTDDLATFDPRQFGANLGSALNRIITSKGFGGRGWAILYLDSEYQEYEGAFRMHWHGWATGRELAAINLLRKTRAYRSLKAVEGEVRDPVRFRVRMTRQPLVNLRYHCTYPVKPEWRARLVPSNVEGNRERSWKTRLPEPYRTMERLFFDRWSIQDISVVRGLRVTREGLVETR